MNDFVSDRDFAGRGARSLPEIEKRHPARRWLPGISAQTSILIAALVCGVFYLLLGSENYIYADDSLRFALYVDSEPTILVHHLILAILFYARQAPSPFAEGIAGTLLFMRVYVAATSVLALTMVGLLTYGWFGSRAAALLAICAVAFSYGFWSYAIITDFYVPAVAFVLTAIYFAERSCAENRWGIQILLASLAVLFASFNHQAHAIVVAPIALVLVFAGRRSVPLRVRFNRALLFIGTTAILGLASFYAAFLQSGDAAFIAFVRGYSGYFMMTPYDRLQPLTPVYTLIGIARTIVFPEVLLGIDRIYDAAHGAFPLKVLIDDRYLVREFPIPLIVAIAATAAAVCLLLGAGLLRTIVLLRRHPVRHPGYWMVVSWTILQLLFFCWWEPISNEFWIWMMPALGLLLVGPLWVAGTARSRRLIAIAVAGLFAANLPVVSQYWSAENCIYWVNKGYASAVGKNDLILTANFYQPSSIDRVRIPGVERYDLLAGSFVAGEPRLMAELEALERRGGALFLDPMLGMPEETELGMRKYYTRRNVGIEAEELRMIEQYCRRKSIPLYAIERKGGDVVEFSRQQFSGYLRWIPAETSRASLGPSPIPSESAP